MRKIDCIVAGHGLEGPDILWIKVHCSDDQYENGDYYDFLREWVRNNAHLKDVSWIADHNDPAGKQLNLRDMVTDITLVMPS